MLKALLTYLQGQHAYVLSTLHLHSFDVSLARVGGDITAGQIEIFFSDFDIPQRRQRLNDNDIDNDNFLIWHFGSPRAPMAMTSWRSIVLGIKSCWLWRQLTIFDTFN